MAFQKRVHALRNSMQNEGCDAFLCSEPNDAFYLTGFPRGLLLIPLETEPVLFVSALEHLAATEEAAGCSVQKVAVGEQTFKGALSRLTQLHPRKVWYDSLQAERYVTLTSELIDTALEGAYDKIWELRRVKDDDELNLIREASELAVYGMAAAAEVIREGVTEIQVAGEAEHAMRSKGSEGASFETLVASGIRSAMPHAKASRKLIQNGELVVVDLGATVGGYRSDLTRTFHTGRPYDLQSGIAKTVLDAQKAAKEQVAEGVGCADVDAVARTSIEQASYGEFFVHSLGHGVGLEVHEPPSLGPRSLESLKARNVVTVEPGIYLPGVGGFRNEDLVVVLRGGYESLTEAAPVPYP